MDKSDIARWKQQSPQLLGKQVKIIYERKKEIVWEVEDIVEHSNNRIDKIIDENMYVDNFVYYKKVNRLKNFLTMFPVEEMEKCVSNFNQTIEKEESKKEEPKQHKTWKK